MKYFDFYLCIFYILIYILKIPWANKRKQYLAKIVLLIIKNNKYCKNIRLIKINKVF